MYTILMNDYGTLTCTTPNVILYQNEMGVDNLHFLVPKKYKNVNLESFSVNLKYINPGNVTKIERLSLKDNNYKEKYLEYILPVDTNFSSIAGNVKLYLTFTKLDAEANKTHITYSSEINIPIKEVNTYINDDFDVIDQKITKLQMIVDDLDKTKADGIQKINDEIYLTSNGTKISDTVSIDDPNGLDLIEF